MSTPGRREEALAWLARRIGAESVVLFTPDLEDGTLSPVGEVATNRLTAREWREAVQGSATLSVWSATLPHPATGHPVPALLCRGEDGSVLAAVGGRPQSSRVRWAARALPAVAATIRGERVNALLEQLREATRFKDDFLATLSHELRTPLNAMLGWIQMLHLYRHDEDVWTRAIEIIERNARAQTQIVADLLDVSRIVTGKLRLRNAPVDLADVVRNGCESVRSSVATKDLTLSIDAASIPGVVVGDADRLEQVVWNLVSNAAKFTSPGGRIDVRLGGDESCAWIVVSDTGVGIHPDFVPHVFERFRQWDSTFSRSYGGLGLGLAIVRHLVELHGGTVHAASDGVGRGATFTVRLPYRRAESPHQAVTGAA